jgi:NDP-4-keto-2,6-dideoxyhexose 3-C-methyltransferase
MSSKTVPINVCLLCNGSELELILDLGNQPLSSVFPLEREGDPDLSPLRLMRCNSNRDNSPTSTCGHVQLSHQASFSDMYGLNYGYNSSLSPLMVKHLRVIHDRIVNFVNISKDSLIIDIGCNDGTFLEMFSTQTQNLFGVDPSSVRFLDVMLDSIQVVPEFFPTPALDVLLHGRKASVISSIAMFYDLAQPKEFVRAVYERLEDDGLWVVELSELSEFLKNLSYDQICHEHLLYIDNESMIRMAKEEGFLLEDITYSEINGGSACYYFRKSRGSSRIISTSKVSKVQLLQMARRAHQNKVDVQRFFSDTELKNQRVIGYGASTKGNVLGNFYELNNHKLKAISDLNSFKWGRVTPGTRIPIISHEEMREQAPDYLFCFIWHLRSEVLESEKAYIEGGGKIVFPLPRLHIVDKSNYHLFAKLNLNDVAFDISSVDLTI